MFCLLWHACTRCFFSAMQSIMFRPLNCGFPQTSSLQPIIHQPLTYSQSYDPMYTHTHMILWMWKSHPFHSKCPTLCKQITEGRGRMEVRAWLKLRSDRSVYIIFLHVQSLPPTVALQMSGDRQPTQDVKNTERSYRRAQNIWQDLQKTKDMQKNYRGVSSDMWVLMTSDTGNGADSWNVALRFNSACAQEPK